MSRSLPSRRTGLPTAFMYGLFACSLWSGCGANDTAGIPTDMGAPPDLTPGTPQIKHVVLLVQENHTFDNYFGRYCTAPAASNPTCNTGPGCCERAPDTEPSGAFPISLDDAANGRNDPDHTQDCELAEDNGGKMDRYVTGVPGCSHDYNWAISPNQVVKVYQDYAAQFALGDRYFQSVAGQSSSNDMYFTTARFVFKDNDLIPNSIGHGCWYQFRTTTRYTGQKTIADLLIAAGKTFGVYAEGYQALKDAVLCPTSFPSDCTSSIKVPGAPNTCVYDPSDYGWQYFAQFADNSSYIKDFTSFAKDLAAGALPSFTYLKGVSYHTEHPNFGNTITLGAAFVKKVADSILNSPYAEDTLILITWDEGGGFFDHVAPPPKSVIDNQPYGTRVPVLAIGKFARKNYVSHVEMEHSSIVKFLEYNFLDQRTGQLGARDTVVNNIGSLLDPSKTGIVIPEN